MTQLITNIYETGEWPNDFIQVTMTASRKKLTARKCSDHSTNSLITYTTKIVVRIPKTIERKIENAIGEDQFRF